MCAYMVLQMRVTPEEAWAKFCPYEQVIMPFRDASKANDCGYECTVLHCLGGLAFARERGWYDPVTFNVKEYEHYERVDNGDINWIIPGKFAACMGPTEAGVGKSPEEYTQIFRKWGVRKVIRLNEPDKYDRMRFIQNGISHADLYFPDGSNPPESIVEEFLRSCERHFQMGDSGAIAVHCKAGLGRTGTLIGVYAI